GLDRVDVAGEAIVIPGDPRRVALADGHVEAKLEIGAGVAAGHAADAELGEAAGDADFRLVGDVADGARERSGTEERALRSAQHLDAVGVEQIEIGREERERDDRLVEVDADLLLDAGLIADDLP